MSELDSMIGGCVSMPGGARNCVGIIRHAEVVGGRIKINVDCDDGIVREAFADECAKYIRAAPLPPPAPPC
jgi:hypothetical protein